MPKAVEASYWCLIYRTQKQITVPESLFANILFMLQYEVSSISDLFIWKKKKTYDQSELLSGRGCPSSHSLFWFGFALCCSNLLLLISHKVGLGNLNKNGTVNKFSLKWCQSFDHSFEQKTNVSYWRYAANRSSPWRASLSFWYLLFPVTFNEWMLHLSFQWLVLLVFNTHFNNNFLQFCRNFSILTFGCCRHNANNEELKIEVAVFSTLLQNSIRNYNLDFYDRCKWSLIESIIISFILHKCS